MAMVHDDDWKTEHLHCEAIWLNELPRGHITYKPKMKAITKKKTKQTKKLHGSYIWGECFLFSLDYAGMFQLLDNYFWSKMLSQINQEYTV